MDNLNKHIDDILKDKVSAYEAKDNFASIDFAAIKNQLPTELLPKVKPSKKFPNYVLLTTIGIATIGIITALIFWNKNNKKVENPINIATTVMPDTPKNIINAINGDTIKIVETTSIPKVNIDKLKINSNKINKGNMPVLVVNTSDDSIENKTNLEKLVTALESDNEYFEVDADRGKILTCKKGTTLKINPNAFTAINKQVIHGKVLVEVIEIYNYTDVIAKGLQTTCNKNLLASAGMLYINAKQNGQAVDVNINNPIEINILPNANKNRKKLFYLNKNANDNLWNSNNNWLPKEGTETLKNELSIRNFGWLNCGEFIQNSIEKTQVKIDLKNKIENSLVKAVIIFPNLHSIVNLSYKNGYWVQQNLPKNEDAYLVCFETKAGITNTAIQKIKIEKEIILAPEYKALSVAEIRAKIAALGNLQ